MNFSLIFVHTVVRNVCKDFFVFGSIKRLNATSTGCKQDVEEEKDETSCISPLAMRNQTSPAVLQTPTGE